MRARTYLSISLTATMCILGVLTGLTAGSVPATAYESHVPSGLTTPPELDNPIEIVVTTETQLPGAAYPYILVDLGGFQQRFFPHDRDVLITFGDDVVLQTPLTIWGGRNIRMIGGEFDVHGTLAVMFANPQGSVFVEGLHVDASAVLADGIALRNYDAYSLLDETPYTFTLQSSFIEGIHGDSTFHGDILQNQTSQPTTLNVENFTGVTGYNGFVIPSTPQIEDAHFSDVNLRLHTCLSCLTRPAYLLMADAGGSYTYSSTFDNVYLEVGEEYGDDWYDWVMTPKSVSGHFTPAPDFLSIIGQTSQWQGQIFRADEDTEDFVTPSDVGENYVSPHPI